MTKQRKGGEIMSENNVFVLPENWNDPDLVDEGEYRVTLTKLVYNDDGDRLVAEFLFLDQGPFAGRKLYQTFAPSMPAGKRLLADLFEAAGLIQTAGAIYLDQAKGKIVRVQVRHNHSDKTNRQYANVTAIHSA